MGELLARNPATTDITAPLVDYWWIAAWMVPIALLLAAFVYWAGKFPTPPSEPGCLNCGHACEGAEKVCGQREDDSGWAGGPCPCEADFHRQHRSVAASTRI